MSREDEWGFEAGLRVENLKTGGVWGCFGRVSVGFWGWIGRG